MPLTDPSSRAVGYLVLRHLYDGDVIEWPIEDDHPLCHVFAELEAQGLIARWDRIWPLQDRYRLTENGIAAIEAVYRPEGAEAFYNELRQRNLNPQDRRAFIASRGLDPILWPVLHDPWTHWSTFQELGAPYYTYVWEDQKPLRRTRHLHDEASRLAERVMPGVERRAQRASRVARCRRDENSLEARLRKDPCVGHTVQGHAASQTEIGQAGFLMECSGYLDERVLQDLLHAGRAIGEALPIRTFEVNGFIRIARRTKEFDKPRRIATLCRGVEFKIVEIECEPAIGRAADQFTDLIDQRWPTISGEAHDFVLVLIYLEAEVRRECRIQHSQGMRKSYFTQGPDGCGAIRQSLSGTDRQGCPLTHSISRQDGGAIRGRGEKGGRGVGLMVFRKQDLASGDAEVGRDNSTNPDFFTKGISHCLRKRAPGVWESAQSAGEYPIEL